MTTGSKKQQCSAARTGDKENPHLAQHIFLYGEELLKPWGASCHHRPVALASPSLRWKSCWSACQPLTVPPASPALASAHVLIIGGSIGGAAAAACLRAAGFRHVQVVERSEGLQAGAGIGMDEATVAVLKGLGVPLATTATGSPEGAVVLQRMRWEEERLASGHTVLRQPMPYFAARYAQLQQGLIQRLPADSVSFGRKAVRLEKLGGDHPDGTAVRVHFATGEPIDCDFCVCVDGPRSGFRQLLQLEDSGKELRFAGYTGWRGVVNEVDLPETARDALHAVYPLYGNCLYFIMSECGRGHAVLYDLGDGLLNWLIYELRPQGPVAEPGRTTSAASSADVRRLHSEARRVWGEALGAVHRGDSRAVLERHLRHR